MIIGICLHCKKEFRKRRYTYKFCSLICSNNHNKNGLRVINLPSFDEQLAELVGICLGDGCVSKYQVWVTLNSNADKNYIPYVISLMRNLFPQVHISIISKMDNATDIKMNSVIISSFFKEMGVISNNKKIPLWIFKNDKFIRACVKGLIDTEGSVSFKVYQSKKGIRYYRQLNFRNTNITFIKFVRDALLKIGLKPTMSLKTSLYISNDADINTYRQIIGFGNPKLEERSRY